jgi:hypothetical protein
MDLLDELRPDDSDALPIPEQVEEIEPVKAMAKGAGKF